MKIGFENIKNNIEKKNLNTDIKSDEKNLQIEQEKYEFFSKNLNKKFNVDYEAEVITFEDGVTYSFDEIAKMKKNILTYDIHLGHLIKDIFGVTYFGNIINEVEDV